MLSSRANSRALAYRSPRPGFTIVELLVAIFIISILSGLLIKGLARARRMAQHATCTNNLRQIGLATTSYRLRWNDAFPDKVSTGGHAYRMAPGMKTPNDPAALVETLGLQAVLEKGQHLQSQGSRAWVCPLADASMRANSNTYTWSFATVLQKPKQRELWNTIWVWDNFSLYAGLSGFTGPFGGYTIPTAKRTYAHEDWGDKDGLGRVNILYADGHVEMKPF